MSIYFVSDVHLSTARPERVQDFIQFLEHRAPQAERLYILGDLFDLCLGDDDDLPPNGEVKQALARSAGKGLSIYLMHGNHDFLMTDKFASQTGCRLIPDPTQVEIDSHRLLLLHGDSLCTDDQDYQEYKSDIRSEASLAKLQAMSLTQRLAKAHEVMDLSLLAVEQKLPEIMDVNEDAVINAFHSSDADIMVHGHTHKPGRHSYTVDGRARQRYVLGDWYAGTSILVWTPERIELTTLNQLPEV